MLGRYNFYKVRLVETIFPRVFNALQQRYMWSKTVLNIKENTLVLFKDSNDHPLKWALGRIDNIVVGKDN